MTNTNTPEGLSGQIVDSTEGLWLAVPASRLADHRYDVTIPGVDDVPAMADKIRKSLNNIPRGETYTLLGDELAVVAEGAAKVLEGMGIPVDANVDQGTTLRQSGHASPRDPFVRTLQRIVIDYRHPII